MRARGWGIDRQERKKSQIPGGVPGGGMVTGRIEPCITMAQRIFFGALKTIAGELCKVLYGCV